VPEDGGDCAFVADVKKDLESSDVKPDTEKLNEYIDQWIRSADSQEEFDERVAEAQGLASTVLGDEFDEKAFKDTVKELQISLGVKLETKALENFKTEMDQISNLISNLDSKLSHLSSVADSLYGQDRLDYIEE